MFFFKTKQNKTKQWVIPQTLKHWCWWAFSQWSFMASCTCGEDSGSWNRTASRKSCWPLNSITLPLSAILWLIFPKNKTNNTTKTNKQPSLFLLLSFHFFSIFSFHFISFHFIHFISFHFFSFLSLSFFHRPNLTLDSIQSFRGSPLRSQPVLRAHKREQGLQESAK